MEARFIRNLVGRCRPWWVQHCRVDKGACGRLSRTYRSCDRNHFIPFHALVSGLDFVELVVTTDHQGDQLAFFFGAHDQGLVSLFNRQIEFLHQGRDGLGVWRVDQAQLLGGSRARGFTWYGFGLLDVRRVVGTVAEDDVVFAGLGQLLSG